MKLNLVLPATTLTLALSACSLGPEAFETEPVRVPTDQGDVYCQLYTRNSVTWDRSIRHPESMSVNQADDICFDMGYKLAKQR